MNKYIVEFIGTFFLVLTICMAVIGGAGDFAPIAIGFSLMCMIFAGGHISGAHYNPAVTLGVFLRGKCDKGDVVGYVVAQLLAAVAAVFLAGMMLGDKVATMGSISTVPAFLAEFLGTFALVYVILNVATAKGTEGNSFYGLAIGCTVTFCAYALGPISGGAFNPAVAVGACLAGLASWSTIAVIIGGNLAGGVAAALVFKTVNPSE